MQQKAQTASITLLQSLCESVNKSLKWVMLLTLLLLAAQSGQPVSTAPKVQRVAQVSVQIIAAEEIRFDGRSIRGSSEGKVARQQRVRDSMPMVEFY